MNRNYSDCINIIISYNKETRYYKLKPETLLGHVFSAFLEHQILNDDFTFIFNKQALDPNKSCNYYKIKGNDTIYCLEGNHNKYDYSKFNFKEQDPIRGEKIYYVQLGICYNSQTPIYYFRMNKKSQLKHVFLAFCTRLSINSDSVFFKMGENILDFDKTPNDYDMNDESVIHCL